MDLYNLVVSAKLTKGEGGDVEVDSLSVTENGTYTAQTGHAYNPVVVNVPSVTPTGNINITSTAQTDVSAYATAQVVDADLVASNIKKDVNILGVTGTYEGGGGGGNEFITALLENADTNAPMPVGASQIKRGLSAWTTLKNLKIAEGVTTIANKVIYNMTALESVDFPSTITDLGSNNFQYATGVKTMFVRAVNPPHLDSSTKGYLTDIEHIYVPSTSVNDYKTNSQWSSLASIIEAIPE